MSRERCGNPVDITDKFEKFAERYCAPYGLLGDAEPLLLLLTIKEAKHQIRVLQKYVEKFTEKEILAHNRHEGDCSQMECPYGMAKARERIRLRKLREENGEESPRREYKPIEGYIYFLAGQNEGAGSYKIGKAINTANRRRWLDVKLPFPCECVHIIKSDDYSKCEDFFHDKFSSKRKNGEWFALTPADVEEIKTISVKNFCPLSEIVDQANVILHNQQT